MGACSKCDGTGVCHNGIHKEEGFLDTALNAATGWMYTCEECGEDADAPGDCGTCDGSGIYGDDGDDE